MVQDFAGHTDREIMIETVTVVRHMNTMLLEHNGDLKELKEDHLVVKGMVMLGRWAIAGILAGAGIITGFIVFVDDTPTVAVIVCEEHHTTIEDCLP